MEDVGGPDAENGESEADADGNKLLWVRAHPGFKRAEEFAGVGDCLKS